MSDWQLWLLAAFGLMIAEVVAPGFWLLSVAVGCFVAAIAGVLPFGLSAQVMAFTGGTLASLVLLRPFLVRRFHQGGVRTNMEALVGKTAVVTQRLGPQGQTGRLLVDGEDWRALSVDDVAIEPGTRVIVVEVDGATLKVEREA